MADISKSYETVRRAWMQKSKAVMVAEFDEQHASSAAEFSQAVFNRCYVYEPANPEMFSDQYGHGFSSFFEDVEQYEAVTGPPRLPPQSQSQYSRMMPPQVISQLQCATAPATHTHTHALSLFLSLCPSLSSALTSFSRPGFLRR